ERAILLATPHGGANLTKLKFLVDVSHFARTVIGGGGGLTKAIAAGIHSAQGEIALDLHPDSLFLRCLGQDRRLGQRYVGYHGDYLSDWTALTLRVGFVALRRVALAQLRRYLPEGALRTQALSALTRLVLPEEVTRGDLIVTSRSADLPTAGQRIGTSLSHLAFLRDPDLIRQVLAVLLRPAAVGE